LGSDTNNSWVATIKNNFKQQDSCLYEIPTVPIHRRLRRCGVFPGFRPGRNVRSGHAHERRVRCSALRRFEANQRFYRQRSRTDVVKFIRQAVLRRYKGAVLADESSGSQISYDNVTEVFTVDGGPQNRSLSNPTGRVRTLLSPRNPLPAAGSAPVSTPAVGSSPSLRSSPALGASDKK